MPRLYTDDQLAAIARPFEDDAIDALRAGDLARVDALLEQMALGHAGLDALSAHALARKVGKLRQDLGEARTLELLGRIGAQLMRTWVDDWRAGREKRGIEALIAVLKHQVGAGLQPVAETDDEVVVDLTPCGSGGRLERQGATTKHPQWYAGWSDGVSSYCQLCKASQRALNDAVGEPVWTTEKGPDGFCRQRFRKTAHRGEQLFDAAELALACKAAAQQARERLAAGDTDLEPLLRGQRLDWKPWHDFGVCTLEYFYAIALEVGGPDYLDEMLAQTYEPAFEAGFPRYAAMSDDALVREIAKTWNYHCADFRLSEEDDRFVFTLDPCGSGGRLFRGQMWRDMFRYGEPLAPTIPQAHDIDFNRRDCPAYCTHCAASNRAQFRGGPLFFVIDGHAQMKPGQACRQYTYKQGVAHQAIDPALPRQVGMDVKTMVVKRMPATGGAA
jgi:hypothetical protein